MSQRDQFLDYFFKALSDTDYALLKFIHTGLDTLPPHSDVDLVIRNQDIADILDLIKNGPEAERVHVHHKSFAVFVSIFFMDESYLEIDLIHRFDRKGIIYLEAADVLQHVCVRADGLKVASEAHHFEYVLLFYHLNGSTVPDRYHHYFTAKEAEQQEAILRHLRTRYGITTASLSALMDTDRNGVKKILNRVKSGSLNRLPSILVNKVRYYADVMRDARSCRGITVTFSGVDGAGKSTVLEEVKDLLQHKYRQRIVVLRHRPSLLPILSSFVHGKKNAERKASNSLPRRGHNTNALSSLLRFFYYYTDYLIGQYYIFFRYTLRGYTVLYDRYYFDFIIDPKRSNIALPRRFTRWLYCFIMKPQVNVLSLIHI